MEADGLRERVTQMQRRLDQAEEARSRIWDRVNEQRVQIATMLGTLQRLEERIAGLGQKLDEAKKERAADREKLDESQDEQGDRRFQAMMVVLAAVAGPLVLGAAYLILGSGHP